MRDLGVILAVGVDCLTPRADLEQLDDRELTTGKSVARRHIVKIVKSASGQGGLLICTMGETSNSLFEGALRA